MSTGCQQGSRLTTAERQSRVQHFQPRTCQPRTLLLLLGHPGQTAGEAAPLDVSATTTHGLTQNPLEQMRKRAFLPGTPWTGCNQGERARRVVQPSASISLAENKYQVLLIPSPVPAPSFREMNPKGKIGLVLHSGWRLGPGSRLPALCWGHST